MQFVADVWQIRSLRNLAKGPRGWVNVNNEKGVTMRFVIRIQSSDIGVAFSRHLHRQLAVRINWRIDFRLVFVETITSWRGCRHLWMLVYRKVSRGIRRDTYAAIRGICNYTLV
jgi:hypothetical protein